MRRSLRRMVRRLGVCEAGFASVEAIVALALLASAVTVAIAGTGVVARSVTTGDKTTTAARIIYGQMEFVKGEPFVPPSTPYPTVATPSGYSVSVQTSAVSGLPASSIERVHVTVFKQGQAIAEADAYKVKR